MKLKFIIQLVLSISLSESLHFYGGTVTWKPVDNTDISSPISIMFTQSYQWKRSISVGSLDCFCNQNIINNKYPLIPNSSQTLDCISTSCGGYTSISVNEFCSDFSAVLDSSAGQITKTRNIAAGSKFCVGFQDGNWITVLSDNCPSSQPTCFTDFAKWSIVSCVNLTVRIDGVINTPPVATIISPVQIPENTITNIKIPVLDADNDYLKCRWAKKTASLDECGDVCKMVPGGTIDRDDCILKFDSNGKTAGQYYAAAMMVEDFYNANSSTALSSVPIQFLIYIVDQPTCASKPIIGSNLSTCTAVQVGIQFSFTLQITKGCFAIVDLFTIPPLNMDKGTLTKIGSSNVWTVTETWIPNTAQLGSQVYCAVATDNKNITSDQYCLTFFVVPAGDLLLCPGDPIPTTTTSTRTTSTSTTTVSTTSITSSTTTSQTTTTTATTSTTATSTTATTTFTTSITTTTATTVTTTETKPGNKPIDSWPIILSAIGLLALCSLCCCWWWWLFCRGTGNHRRRQPANKAKVTNKYFSFNDKQLQNFSMSMTNKFRRSKKTNTISTYDPQDRLLLSSRATTTSSFKCLMHQPSDIDIPYRNIYNISPRIKNNNTVSVTRIHKSLSVNANEKLSLAVNHNIDPFNINSSPATIRKTSQNVTVSKVHRSKSLTTNRHKNQKFQSNGFNQQSMRKSPMISKRSSSVRVIRLKRLSTSNLSKQSNPSNNIFNHHIEKTCHQQQINNRRRLIRVHMT